MSLNKNTLWRIIAKQTANPRLRWLSQVIIFHDPTKNFLAKGDLSLLAKIPKYKSLFSGPADQGLPIGNLTSQFFANVYLDRLDQFVKHQLKVRYYLRYVDDFLLLSTDKKQLKDWRCRIEVFLLNDLNLKLNQRKEILQNINKGIDWLGYIVKPNCLLIRRRVVKNFKKKLWLFNQQLANNQGVKPSLASVQQMLAVINSYYGHFKHADTFRLGRHLFLRHFGRLKDYLEPKDIDFFCLQIKPKTKTAEAESAEINGFPLPADKTT